MWWSPSEGCLKQGQRKYCYSFSISSADAIMIVALAKTDSELLSLRFSVLSNGNYGKPIVVTRIFVPVHENIMERCALTQWSDFKES